MLMWMNIGELARGSKYVTYVGNYTHLHSPLKGENTICGYAPNVSTKPVFGQPSLGGIIDCPDCIRVIATCKRTRVSRKTKKIMRKNIKEGMRRIE